MVRADTIKRKSCTREGTPLAIQNWQPELPLRTVSPRIDPALKVKFVAGASRWPRGLLRRLRRAKPSVRGGQGCPCNACVLSELGDGAQLR